MNGYVYSKGTRKGFERMRRLGIPRPIFRIQDKLAKVVYTQFRECARGMLQDIKRAMTQANVTTDGALVQDEALDDLLDFFDQMKKETEAEKEAINRANMGAAENTLSHNWFDGGDEDVSIERETKTRKAIYSVLGQEQDDYLKRLYDDADDRIQGLLSSFSIDKQKAFNDNMAALRILYLDNSMDRLNWEQDYIKRETLKRIHKYVIGKSEHLDLDDLQKYAFERGKQLSRLFARDQMQRFNKALTLSTFTAAKVTKVKWVTSHDTRVRGTHRLLDGQIFDINNLPEEVDDYNCRCGLVPVEWED